LDKEDIFRLAGDPRFIPGIYNYCDRWCERCPFTSRCLTYAMEADNTILRNDADGSVKVALIGMDRSIGAWGRLQEYFSEKTNSILDILLHLDRLRRRTEELFPQAKSFKRPGFDEPNP